MEKRITKKWDNEIMELENYFSNVKLPDKPIRLNKFTRIIDGKRFVDSHLHTVKRNNGNKTFLPYLERLYEFSKVLTEKQLNEVKLKTRL